MTGVPALNGTWAVTGIAGAVVTLAGPAGSGSPAGGNIMGGFRISGNWGVAPVAGEVWVYFSVSEVIDSGDHVVYNMGSTTVQQLYGDTARYAGNQGGRGKVHTFVLSQRDISWNRNANPTNFYGNIVDVEVNVTKVYNGGGSGCLLQVLNESSVSIIQVDLTKLGVRFLSKARAEGAQAPNDTVATANFITWCKQIYWFVSNAAFTQITDAASNPSGLPEFVITVRWAEV